ncbi:ATP-binding protein [Opitutaceae bacterium LMO-CP1]|nr:ATP-binding protein [Opitutaceae bacterium LMO-M01]
MNGVIGMTTLLLDTPLDSEQRDFVDIVRSSGESLLTIINDILDFSKIESGKIELEDHPYTLHQCIEEALELLAPRALDKGLEVISQLDPTLPAMVVGDVTRLRQVIVNLLGNAIKFTAEGEVRVSVSRGETHPSGELTLNITVADTGIGIPPEKQDRLFKSFSQVDSSTTREFGGTGLGLAISKRLIELMSGSVSVESEADQGAKFHFDIKVRVEADTPPRWLAGVPELEGRRMLLLEDNAAQRENFQQLATGWGIDLIAVETAAAAREVLRKPESQFDLVVIDHEMLGNSADAVLTEMAGLPGSAASGVFLFTARGQAKPSRNFRIISKPLRPVSLLEQLARAVTGDQREEKRVASTSPFGDAERSLAERLPLRLLVVDDNAVNQKVACMLLKRLGYVADSVGNGLEALQALDQKTYDLILMDVQMPEMDGYETARRICEKWEPLDRPRPRIVAMTGNAMQGDRELCLEAGMDDYIAKPVRVDEVSAALERWGAECAAAR